VRQGQLLPPAPGHCTPPAHIRQLVAAPAQSVLLQLPAEAIRVSQVFAPAGPSWHQRFASQWLSCVQLVRQTPALQLKVPQSTGVLLHVPPAQLLGITESPEQVATPPLHALLQHTPPTQFPFVHWTPWLHA
jgi:hypothetical protein